MHTWTICIRTITTFIKNSFVYITDHVSPIHSAETADNVINLLTPAHKSEDNDTNKINTDSQLEDVAVQDNESVTEDTEL